MSAKATFWAWEVDVDSVHQRAVLLCLADCHNADTGRCDPSVMFIAKKTKCDRKTVMKVIGELTKNKLIKATKRQGTSTQYELNTSTTDGTSTTNGTSTTSGTLPVPPEGHPPVPPVVPKPISKPKKNLKHRDIDLSECPDQISIETAKEFIDHRINKKAKLTQNAFDRQMKLACESNELNLTPDQIIQETIDAGWQGISLNYLANRLGANNAKRQTTATDRRQQIADATYGADALNF